MRITILFLFALAIITAGFSQAETIYVSGDVSGVWSADTVMVTGEIRVLDGASLTINPGVQVRFTGWYKFIIQGELQAAGTAADTILFTRAFPTEESKWRGFRFDAADDSSVLEYCRIEYAKGTEGFPDVRGGGIWVSNCSPTVRRCTIQLNYSHNGNYNGMGGGICLNENSFSLLEYNCILQNEADSGGGISIGWGSDPIVRHNTIESNTAFSAGGGIYVSADAEATIYGNTIRANASSGYGGGGINLWSATWLYGTYSFVYGNLIIGNSATDAGGGLYSRYDASLIYANTIVNNVAGRGAGVYVLTFSTLPPSIFSTIIWGNSAPTGAQILLDPVSGSTANITYCDVQGGWSGSGNISTYPAFLDTLWSDYRLQWGSPCIDSGDPASIYNDPDGTRADMGAFYFDQSSPVRITLTPHDTPIIIPEAGGNFTYTIQAANIESTLQTATIWCEAMLPSGSIYGPVLGPAILSLGPNTALSRERTQAVPAAAPGGCYSYQAYAVVGPDTSEDAFTFIKQGAAHGETMANWPNWGEALSPDPNLAPLMATAPSFLVQVRPNPFNPRTVISFDLPQSSWVKWRVFDLSGRSLHLDGLTDGWYEPGRHDLVFDGSKLPSGIYVYHLQAVDLQAVGKLILVR
jgi:parallel beta-helix repeat protein